MTHSPPVLEMTDQPAYTGTRVKTRGHDLVERNTHKPDQAHGERVVVEHCHAEQDQRE